MGIKGLWKILQSASSTESLSQLAMRGFEASTCERGYRIGIDASIWFGHMQVFDSGPQFGQNPGLQMLFFRCARLLTLPILPLFVFDGLSKPDFKRGKPVKHRNWKGIAGAQTIIEAFGFAWHYAPGEAEAELAYLNRIGSIDAVWTDDSDTFLFGATTIIRSTLSANIASPVVNSSGKQDDKHVHLYNAVDLVADERIQLNQHGLILIALLRGGDYHKGVEGIGMTIAHALARCGFGDRLATAAQSLTGNRLEQFLAEWRSDIIQELHTDSRGHLGKRHPVLASKFPGDFPDLKVYKSYAKPIVSDFTGKALTIDWYRALDLAGLATACELYFEWGSKDQILDRFRSLIWQGAVCRILRHITIEEDKPGRSSAILPAGSVILGGLVIQIHSERAHTSTDMSKELRLEISPNLLVKITGQGTTSGRRIPPPSYTHRKKRIDPFSRLRIWMPEFLVRAALPQLVHSYDVEKLQKPERKGKRSAALAHESSDSESDFPLRKAARTGSPQNLQPKRRQNIQSGAPSTSSRSMTADDIIVISSSDEERTSSSMTTSMLDTGTTQRTATRMAVITLSSSDDEVDGSIARRRQRGPMAAVERPIIDLT